MLHTMKIKDATHHHARNDAKQKATSAGKANALCKDLDVIKARKHLPGLVGDQTAGDKQLEQQPQAHASLAPSNQPDPLLLVALHASRPHLLSLDDLLACRCVCKQWRQRLGTAFCHSVRIPHSLWSESANSRFGACIREAAAAYAQATHLVLDAGGSRPGLPRTLWDPLLLNINPWLQHPSTSSNPVSKPISSAVSCNLKSASINAGGLAAAGGVANTASSKCIHLHLQAPPSPQRLEALTRLSLLSHLQLQHTNQSLYSRHLAALAGLTQLRSLVLMLTHPRLDLRSLAHQRARRVPLKMDCLSRLQQLTQLELISRGPTGEYLPDTIAAFSSPASLAALSNLRCLAISEAALPGPATAGQWLEPLSALQQLQLVQQDDPGKRKGGKGTAAAGSSTCGTAASTAASNAGSLAGGLLSCAGGFSALAAAAAAAGRSGLGTAEQLQALQQQQQQLQALLPGLQGQLQSQLQAQQQYTGRLSNSGGGAAAVGGAMAAQQQQQQPGMLPPARTSSFGSEADSATAADGPCLPPLDFSSVLPNLNSLTVANLAGERLIGLKVPTQLTKLALHLATPCPGAVTGEQLAAVVLQSSQSLVSLELGLGMRFSLSGGVMRSLKRGLKVLKDLTLVEGTQDHLEGLGCWCNLRRLELVEGRCSVPLRGLYELSMRAAMGRTPGVLRYCGHVRHVEELAGRLGGALQELRLDSLTGLGAVNKSTLNTAGSDACEQLEDSSFISSPGSGISEQQQQDDSISALPLSQLVSLTRLELHGDRLGLLDATTSYAVGNLKQLIVLEVVGQEAWLAPELGVKEQLGFVKNLTRLRQLRLGGVMIGRSRLAGTGSSSSSTGTTAAASDKPVPTSSSKPGSSKSSGVSMPPVKGLGNGLSSSSSGSSSNKAAAQATPVQTAANAASPAVTAATTAGVVLDPAAAAARDLMVSVALEELRRWLCQVLPHCRVWLD